MTNLEISGSDDRIKVAGILIANGYTVRVVTVKKNNTRTKVLQYEKNEKKGGDQSNE